MGVVTRGAVQTRRWEDGVASFINKFNSVGLVLNMRNNN